MKVLIIGPDKDINEMVEATIQRTPEHEFQHALVKQAALDRIREGNPDMVLLDMDLPPDDIREISAELEARAIPVIAHSSEEFEHTPLTGPEVRTAGFLKRPFDKQQARNMVATVMASRGAREWGG
jgi:DNA-binding response OmpR family regulator